MNHKAQSGDDFSNCDDEMYSNVDHSVQTRMFAARSSRERSQSLKKKPMPLPKPLQAPTPTPLTNNRNNSSSSSVHPEFYKDNHHQYNSTGKYGTYQEDLDEPSYDDVYLWKGDSGSPQCQSLPSTVLTPQEALYEEAREVRRERLSLYPAQIHHKPKTAETIASEICEDLEPQYSEAMPVREDKLGLHENEDQMCSDLDSAVQADALLMTMEGDEDPIYDDVNIETLPEKRAASECPPKLPPTTRAQATGVVIRPKQISTRIEPPDIVSRKQLCSGKLSESHLYEEPVPVVNSQLQESECVDNMCEPIYDEAATVLARNLLPSEKDEEPLYDEAAVVKASCLRRPDFGKNGKAVKQRNIKEPDKEPVYEEARHVVDSKLPLGERETTLQKPSPIVMRCKKKEDLYRRAASVRGSFMEDSSDEDEPTYYNLLLVKMSLERCNRLFYAAFDHQFTMEKLENKARRLSRLWGDGPGLKIAMIPETRSLDYHQQLKPVKSESYTKTMAADIEDYHAEDMDNDVAESFMSHVAENDRTILRKWIVTHILDSEKNYISILDLLSEHMQTFKSIANTEKFVIQAKDNAVIFFKIPDLHKTHYKFVNSLGKKVEGWSTDQEVGAVFRDFADKEYNIARDYLRNYHEAISTVQRCWTENPVFAELTKVMHVKSGNSTTDLSLEELLHKPIVRFQQITLSMKDLIKSTPLNHPDYDILQKALKTALNCLNECKGVGCRNSNLQRYLVKHSLVVEKVDSLRKLRHLFLFSDVVVCAKQKLYSRKRNFYETKWFISLQDLQLEEKFSVQADRHSASLHQQVIDGLEKELIRLQMNLKQEMKKFKKLKSGDAQQSKKIEHLQKKIFHQEAALLEASPFLELKLYNTKFGKDYIFLMSSDYERTTWKEAINGMTAKVEPSALRITPSEVTNLLQSQKIPKLIGSVLKMQDISLEREHLSGSLKITIHTLQGLTEEAETFCVVEIDCFGHFFLKAKTNQCRSKEPSWAEDFDIDLEGAQTLRLLCYRIGVETDQLLGKCSLELNRAWLSEEFKEQPIPLTDQMVITISLKYTPQEQMMRRSICLNKGMFGVRLENISERERRLVPTIVTSCIHEIEARGLDELGIYRVSGLSSEIERLKSAFNKSKSNESLQSMNTLASRSAVGRLFHAFGPVTQKSYIYIDETANDGASAAALIKDVDVNVLTSLLKFFFRELPESLFTDVAYQQFVKGIALADPEAKEKFLVNAFRQIPKCNFATALLVLEHLIRISQKKDKNKMTLENLATVFGPTLLRPAEVDRRPMTMEQRLWLGASDIAAQATILLYFLKLKASNYSFNP